MRSCARARGRGRRCSSGWCAPAACPRTTRASLNLGIGMLAVSAPGDADALGAALGAAGESAWEIGRIEAGPRGVEWQAP